MIRIRIPILIGLKMESRIRIGSTTMLIHNTGCILYLYMCVYIHSTIYCSQGIKSIQSIKSIKEKTHSSSTLLPVYSTTVYTVEKLHYSMHCNKQVYNVSCCLDQIYLACYANLPYSTLPQGYALTGAIYVGNYRIVFFIKYLHRVQYEKYYENSANKCEFLLPQAMSGAVLLVSPVNSRRIYPNKYMKVTGCKVCCGQIGLVLLATLYYPVAYH